jgi:hypothetical protein
MEAECRPGRAGRGVPARDRAVDCHIRRDSLVRVASRRRSWCPDIQDLQGPDIQELAMGRPGTVHRSDSATGRVCDRGRRRSWVWRRSCEERCPGSGELK